jgi:hypothetical protein
MKSIALLIVTALVGCASAPPQRGMSLAQIENIKVYQRDCANMDKFITDVENQLRIRGTFGKNPEDLSEEDRRYNSAGKIIIWSLRIGCNNPQRYSS